MEDTEHFFLRCLNFSAYRVTLLDEIKNIEPSILSFNSDKIVNILLYGDSNFSVNTNAKILQSSIKYIIETSRFNDSIMNL